MRNTFTLEELRALMKRIGLATLARDYGLSRSYLQRIANGKCQPSARVLEAFGLEVCYRDIEDGQQQQAKQADSPHTTDTAAN